MISKIKLIKTFPNSHPLGTEFKYIERYNYYTNNIGNYLTLQMAIDNIEFYELVYEPKFKIGDYLTDFHISGIVTDIIKNDNLFKYILEFGHLQLDGVITTDNYILSESKLQLAGNTVTLFDRLYFEKDVIWKCDLRGLKLPKEMTIKTYIEHVKSNNIQHFKFFPNKEEAEEWLKDNKIQYSNKDLENIIKDYSYRILYMFPELSTIVYKECKQFIKEL